MNSDRKAAFPHGRKLGEPDGNTSIGVPNYQRVASAIRHDIINGILEDGRRITTTELAYHYRLSLAPIREALLQLSAEGIIELHPKRGATIRAITTDFLAQVYEVRLGLIPYLEGARAAKASFGDISQLKAAELRFEDAAARSSINDMIRHNVEFHDAMMDVSINREATQLLARHRLLLAALRQRYGYDASHSARAIDEHHRMIHAYETASADAAQKVSHTHLQHSFEELLERMGSSTD